MKIRALQALTIRDNSGALNSIAYGAVSDVSSELGEELISDGLAEAYTLISPTGSISITENGTVDVTQYAQASVNVADFKNLVDRSITSVTADMLQGVTSIGEAAFVGCNSLVIAILGNVTSIDDYAFSACYNLERVFIGSLITSIGDHVFPGDQDHEPALVQLSIEATVPPTLGSNNFNYVKDLFKIYVPAASVDAYKSAPGWSGYASRIRAEMG